MKPLNCYIVDDEFSALELLGGYIRQTPGLHLSGATEKPLVALQEIQSLQPGLVFLDVDMPLLSGLELAGMPGLTAPVVFTTAFREYALAAYDRQVFDYLLKPITYERFLKCIVRVRQHLGQAEGGADRFYIKTGIAGQLTKIELAEISYIEAAQNYVRFFLPGRALLAYLSIGEVEARLPAAEFSRIHKSFIVHHTAISLLEPGQLKLKDGATLPVGRAYKEKFNAKLAQLVFKSRREP
jgi:DNA-binding LytR/AlgR family response regulator